MPEVLSPADKEYRSGQSSHEHPCASPGIGDESVGSDPTVFTELVRDIFSIPQQNAQLTISQWFGSMDGSLLSLIFVFPCHIC